MEFAQIVTDSVRVYKFYLLTERSPGITRIVRIADMQRLDLRPKRVSTITIPNYIIGQLQPYWPGKLRINNTRRHFLIETCATFNPLKLNISRAIDQQRRVRLITIGQRLK